MASYVYPPVVPPGQTPPLAVITESDHRAWIFITAALGLSMTLLATGIRAFIRCGTRSAWGLDDGTLGVSTLLSFIQSSLVLAAASDGLGRSEVTTSGASKERAEKLYYASNMVYVLCLGCSRVAMVLFLRRLTPVRIHVRILTALFAAEAAWMVAVLLVVALQCGVAQPWALGRHCGSAWFTTWEAAEAIGATFELTIFALAAWTLTWRIKMPSSKKAVIISSFGLRLAILIAVIAARLSSFDKAGFFTDPTLHEAVFVCWTQAEMNLSIIAATIPIAHKFLLSLVTNYGGAGGRNMSESKYRTSPRHPNSSIRMESLKSTLVSGTSTDTNNTLKSDNDQIETCIHQGDDHRYSYDIDGGRSRPPPTEDGITNISDAMSVKSTGSRKMMIRKDVTYQVDFET
ncbi:hypothetical protein M409DRAFT_28968 [Zasmidium cellare ATCC 36951]|uniref:Rhodopsin domain-containing protein n=1 Tax=Zasmidium cellare ATCC 36951 TaxID=1080233 RepID=A0A6A6C3Z7_ZASCE|nr:uncharacterized protein M409DRAFT_28968 [Zasmidium cellare ATCC 36951]KAF2160582.1 hypothetical protein M409DRAFT_28968 [Zasmidium cellare ATCC 36951]